MIFVPNKFINWLEYLCRIFQKFAMYDRFGKLLLGSRDESRKVLEYVVFECHVASLDGIWRLHDKVLHFLTSINN